MKRRLLILLLLTPILYYGVRCGRVLYKVWDRPPLAEQETAVDILVSFYPDGLIRKLDVGTFSFYGDWSFDDDAFKSARLEKLLVSTPQGAPVPTADIRYEAGPTMYGGRFTMTLPDLPVEVTELRVSGDFVVLRPDGSVFRSYAFDHTARLIDDPSPPPAAPRGLTPAPAAPDEPAAR